MTSKTVYAVIAVIVIAIVAIGAAFAFSGGSNSIEGTYELQEGSIVIMDGDDVKQEQRTAEKLTIEKVDGDTLSGNWDGYPFTGTITSQGYMTIALSFGLDGGETFYENGSAYLVGNAIYYVSLCANEDMSKTVAASFIFTKDGAKAEVSTTPSLTKGTVFESFKFIHSVDGETTVSNPAYTVTVSETYGFISVLDHKVGTGSSVAEWKTLAVQYGSKEFRIGYNAYNGMGWMYSDGKNAEIHYNYEAGDSSHASIFCMSSEPYERPSTEALASKVYTGTANTMGPDGKKYTVDTVLSFGDYRDGIFSVVEKYGDKYYMDQVSTIKNPSSGYNIMFSDRYSHDGIDAIVSVTGYITEDLSKMYLVYVTFYEDGSSFVTRSVLTLTDKVSFLGTYDLRGGNEAYLSGKDYAISEIDPSAYVPEGYGLFNVVAYDGDFLVAEWGPDTIRGAATWDGSALHVTTLCIPAYGGYKYVECGEILIENGLLIYNGVATDAAGKTSYAISYELTKTGMDIALPEYTPILNKGDVYNSYGVYKTEDGTSAIDGMKSTAQVLDRSGAVYVLEVIDERDGKESVSFMLAAQDGKHSLKGAYPDDRHHTDVFVNGNNLAIDSRFVEDGKDILLRVSYAKGQATSYNVPDISGKVYTGTWKMLDNGNVTESDFSIAFGEYRDKRITATMIIGGVVKYEVFQPFFVDSSDAYDIRATFHFDTNGTHRVSFFSGTISKDLSALNLYGTNIKVDGGVIAVNVSGTLVKDTTGIVGNYTIKTMNRVWETGFSEYEVDESFGYYFTVVEVKDRLVRGAFAGTAFLGVMDDNGILTFSSNKAGFSERVSVKFYDGACLVGTAGVKKSDTPFSSIIKYAKDGAKKVEEIPAVDTIFKKGDSFTSFETVRVADGEETEAYIGQKLVCTYASNGLYVFTYTKSDGTSYAMTGYTIPGDIVRASALLEGSLATYNIHKHSDSFICMDREYMKNGLPTTIVFRMSDDGTPQTVHEYPSLEGYQYSGVWNYYSLKEGEISETGGFKSTTTYGKTVASITTKISGSNNYPAHMFIDEAGKLTRTESFSVSSMDGETFWITYYCYFSADCKTVTIYGVGNSADGIPRVVTAELQLIGIAN